MEPDSPDCVHKSGLGKTLELDSLWDISKLEDELKLSVLLDGHQHHENRAEEDLSKEDQRLNKLVFSIESDIQNSLKIGIGIGFEEFAINQVLHSIRFVRDCIVKCNENVQDQLLQLQGETKEANPIEVESLSVRLRPIQILLERLFIRYWDTRKDFDNVAKQQAQPAQSSQFLTLIEGLLVICEECHSWISKRIVTKFLLGLNQHTSAQVGKLCFLVGWRSSSAASTLLQPVDTFLAPNSPWSKAIIDNVILKITTKSELFWTNWANYIVQSTRLRLDVWNQVIKGYSGLCSHLQKRSVHGVASHLLIPATYCLLALGKGCLAEGCFNPTTASSTQQQIQIEQMSIFQEMLGLLEHSNVKVRCCGAISAKLLRDVLDQTLGTSASDVSKFEFSFSSIDDHELYTTFMRFLCSDKYETAVNGDSAENHLVSVSATSVEKPEEDDSNIFHGMDLDFISKARAWNLDTFNDVLELFTESPSGLSDRELALLRNKALLRIPVLIYSEYKFDSKVASRITRLICEHDFEPDMNFPLALALYKMVSLQPKDVSVTLAEMCFDSTHYSLGQRLNFLNFYLQMIQLLSGKKCLECLHVLTKYKQAWQQLDKVFWNYFTQETASFRKCVRCRKELLLQKNPMESHSVSLVPASAVVDTKTRRFASPRVPLEGIVFDSFGNQFSQHLWSPIWSNLCKFPQTNTMDMSGVVINYVRLATQLLSEIFNGTSPSSPFVIFIAPQVTDLLIIFIQHDNVELKLIILQFLGFYLQHSNGNSSALFGLNSRVDVFQYLADYSMGEVNLEVKELIKRITTFAKMSGV